MTENDIENRWIMTVGFIFILILVRTIFGFYDNIVYIIYAINWVGLLYVAIQLMLIVYSRVNKNILPNSTNIIIKRRNRKIKKIFSIVTILFVLLASAIGIVFYILKGEKVLSIINDVIALITLGVSIEDKQIGDLLYRKCTTV